MWPTLACKVNDGTVDLRQIGRLSDEQVVETLTQVQGDRSLDGPDVPDLLAGASRRVPARRPGRADGHP